MVGKPERRCLFLVQTNISGSNPLPGTWFFLIIVFSWNAATCEGRGICFFTQAMTSYDCTPFFSLRDRGYHIYNIIPAKDLVINFIISIFAESNIILQNAEEQRIMLAF